MHQRSTHNMTEIKEFDDLDAYIATFTEEEREALAVAEAAIDIAIRLPRVQELRRLDQQVSVQHADLRLDEDGE
jgi:hypothetical protein